MTARAETAAPLSALSRLELIEYRDELRALSSSVDLTRGELRQDADRLPIPRDVVRIVAEASDLLLVAARLVDPEAAR